MGTEIERKFLVASEDWRASATDAVAITQGYLSRPPDPEVRVRRAGEKGFLTVKTGRGLVRSEHEWEIGPADADELLDRCLPMTIAKVRHHVRFAGLLWEVDEFAGPHRGLVVAEVELTSADQAVERPPWLGAEVTGQAPFANANLSRHPDPTAPPAVYVASPLGFSESGRRYARDVLLPAVEQAGMRALDPWDDPEATIVTAQGIADPVARRAALTAANQVVGRRNADLIRSSVGVLAVLDGTDVDSGTASEIGFAAALGLPVVGLRTDFRLAADNEGSIVNLQVEWFVGQWGGRIFTELDAAVAHLGAAVGAGTGSLSS